MRQKEQRIRRVFNNHPNKPLTVGAIAQLAGYAVGTFAPTLARLEQAGEIQSGWADQARGQSYRQRVYTRTSTPEEHARRVAYADHVVEVVTGEFPLGPAEAEALHSSIMWHCLAFPPSYEYIVDHPSVANWRLNPTPGGGLRLACRKLDPGPADLVREQRVTSQLAVHRPAAPIPAVFDQLGERPEGTDTT